MKYGYLRVSTDRQNYERQLFVLKECGLDRIFEEKISGTKRACGREQFEIMLRTLTAGDEVYFESMSRMARSMQDLIDTTNLLVKSRKVKVIFLKENLTIGGGNGLDAMGALIFNIMGAFAQFERDLISDRTRQSLQAKKAQGVVLGAKRQYDDAVVAEIREMHSRGMSYWKIAEVLGIPKTTVARLGKESE